MLGTAKNSTHSYASVPLQFLPLHLHSPCSAGSINKYFDDPMLLELARQDVEFESMY